MTPEYIIFSSEYQVAADSAKELGLEIGHWKWIRDKFKEPVIYKRVN